MGFIYKITNIITNKIYIGQTILDNPEERWKSHIRAINRNKGCPALRDAMKKYGISNFKFEVIIICFDDDRFFYEEEYIRKYNTMVPNGYNILKGGIGGSGFKGKYHTPDTISKIKESLKDFNINNPNYFETYRDKHKQAMLKVNLSSCVSHSEKFKKALQENKVGVAGWKSSIIDNGKISMPENIKEKISKSLTNLNKNIENIYKHRETMANAVGRKVIQYSLNDDIIAEYPSISEAARKIGCSKGSIQFALNGTYKKAAGFKWKYNDSVL